MITENFSYLAEVHEKEGEGNPRKDRCECADNHIDFFLSIAEFENG